VKITEVEAIVLRQPVVDGAIADGSQDDLIVRVHTDEGIVGVGEVDSAPEVVKAVIDAPNSHCIATGLRHVLIGADPLDIEGLWRRHGFTALLVTHDVQEAVALGDRIVLIDSGRISFDAAIDLPRPRSRASAAFAKLEEEVLMRVLGGGAGGVEGFGQAGGDSLAVVSSV